MLGLMRSRVRAVSGEWGWLHQQELLGAWEDARRGRPLPWIEPLPGGQQDIRFPRLWDAPVVRLNDGSVKARIG